jgi:phosphomethylpyrimidine synthase
MVPVRVNASIGLSKVTPQNLDSECKKIWAIRDSSYAPDLMMDLSIVRTAPEPWEMIRDDFGCPVGILPHYLCFDKHKGIDPTLLLARVHRLIDGGIGFITIHVSPTLELFRSATELRATPITSRGGSIIIRDMLLTNRTESVYVEIFDAIAIAAAHSGVVVNLGAAFRSSCIADGMDAVTLNELDIQEGYIRRARDLGASVVLEGPGHLTLSQAKQYVEHVASLDVPIMPLGPMVTDAFPSVDHITNAIGASFITAHAKGGIINTVTRVEHTGGVPNTRLILEALAAARVAAHSATISYHEPSKALDRSFSVSRASIQSCVLPNKDDPSRLEMASPGCSRCGDLCPLVKSSYRDQEDGR